MKARLMSQLKSEASREIFDLLTNTNTINIVTDYFGMPDIIKAELIELYDSVDDRNLVTIVRCYQFYCTSNEVEEGKESFVAYINEILDQVKLVALQSLVTDIISDKNIN